MALDAVVCHCRSDLLSVAFCCHFPREDKVFQGPHRSVTSRGEVNSPLGIGNGGGKQGRVLPIRPPLTGVKIPKIRKRGFRGRKTPISPCPRKGHFESKNPHFPCVALYRNGDVLPRNTLLWGGGNVGFSTPKPSFPDFGDFDPCKGRTDSQVASINPPIDDTGPIWKFSIDPRSHTDLQNPADFSPKGKPIRNFSIDPTSSIWIREKLKGNN